MNTLGLSFGYHDSSISLVRGGKVLFAAAEERLTRQKHDSHFPTHALREGLLTTGIEIGDISRVVYHEDPFSKFSRVLASSLSRYPFAYREFAHSMKSWGGKKLWTLSQIRRHFYSESTEVNYLGHHFSHALQAFLGSGFERSAILIVDAVGDWSCSALFHGIWQNGRPEIRQISEIAFPNSLGLVYSAITAYLGFVPNENECNTMALAAFGQPLFAHELEQIIRLDEDGFYSVDHRYFNFVEYYKGAVTDAFIKKFGPPRNIKSQPLAFHAFLEYAPVNREAQRFANMAASLQKVLEHRIIDLARVLKRETNEEHLCLAGGVALNCLANSALYHSGIFKKMHIPPDPGDGGTSIGSALYANALQAATAPDAITYGPYLGPAQEAELDLEMLDFISVPLAKPYSMASESLLKNWHLVKKQYFADENDLCSFTADLLIQKKIVGWCQGRSEFGPRALGNRSILIRPDCLETATRLSRFVKKRASFRPYALSMTEISARQILNSDEAFLSHNRWMQFTAPVREQFVPRVRAGLHVDLTTRPQVCSAEDNPRFHKLLQCFGSAFGIEVVLNTSFNPSGYPMVTFPSEALAMFYRSDMDALVLGNWVVWKSI